LDETNCVYFGGPPKNINQRFNAAARDSQPPHGLIPTYDVARLITSPKPISFSVKNPGSLIGLKSDLDLSVVTILSVVSMLILIDVEAPGFGTPSTHQAGVELR
jgi:hypothetical protein